MNQRRPLTVCNFGQTQLEDLAVSINYDTIHYLDRNLMNFNFVIMYQADS